MAGDSGEIASSEGSRYYLILSEDLGYGDVSNIKPLIEEISKLLDAYMHSILNYKL